MKNNSSEYENGVARLKLEYEIEMATVRMMAEKSGYNHDKNWYI